MDKNNIFYFLLERIKERTVMTIMAVVILFILSIQFIRFEANANLSSISITLLTYSGLLLIFYVYVMEAHYKELHQIATDPQLQEKKNVNIDYYEKSLNHNELVVLLSFFGILALLSSGIINILNLELKLGFLLDTSAIVIFATSLGILIVLWYILKGKINDANGALNDYKNKKQYA